MPGAPPGAPNSDGAPPLQPPGTVGDGAGSTSTANESGPGGSNTTSQTIWQVEISGCLSECQGTSQIQTAEQQNTTVQELDGTAAVPTAAETQTGLDTHSQSTADIGQIRLGCVADCFGTTSTMSAAISNEALQALEQILSVLGTPGSQSQSLGQATEQNTVDQAISQWQEGAPVQSQIASQSNVTTQVVNLAGWVARELQAALAPSVSPVAGLSNATRQGIWQVQVGCMIFCSGTVQSQQADQSNITLQVVRAGTPPAVQAGAAAINIATQLIWQVQIGCVFWCYDTVQIQSAASSNNTLQVIETVLAPPSPPTPPIPLAPANGSAGPPDMSGGTAGGSGTGGSQGTARSGGDPGTTPSAGGSGGGSPEAPPPGLPKPSPTSPPPAPPPTTEVPESAPAAGIGSTARFRSSVAAPVASAPLTSAHGPAAPTSGSVSSTGGATGETVNQSSGMSGAAPAAAGLVVASGPTRALYTRHSLTRNVAHGSGGPGDSRHATLNLRHPSRPFQASTAAVPGRAGVALGSAEIALLAALGMVLVGFAYLRATRAASRAAR